jgi:NAD(P)H-dependent flavin oxidoreductase YrpB (nitropropane dioxygenase family)
MVTMDAVQRGHRYPEQAKQVNFNPVGQVVGQMKEIASVKQVIYRLVNEYLEATERLQSLATAQ